jgi:hypothetical protein
MKKPLWRDAEAVVDWIIKMRRHSLLAAMGLEESPGGFYQVGPFTVEVGEEIYSILDADPDPTDEEIAVEAAMHGNFKKLGEYFKSEAHLQETSDLALRLTPATLRLAAEVFSGERNIKTGRLKSEKQQRGRGKMTKDERAARNPIHNAARLDFPAAMQVLREEYPGRREEDYRDRAIAIVERTSPGVKKKTLRNYLNRPKRGRHRI